MLSPIKYLIQNTEQFQCYTIICGKQRLNVVASIDDGWEHVSVSLQHRQPTWDEMCFVKRKFWEDEEMIIQYHPKKSEYVNVHKYCLHLWKPPAEIEKLLL